MNDQPTRLLTPLQPVPAWGMPSPHEIPFHTYMKGDIRLLKWDPWVVWPEQNCSVLSLHPHEKITGIRVSLESMVAVVGYTITTGFFEA